MGGRRPPTRRRPLLHQLLAARTTRGQQTHRRQHRLERAVLIALLGGIGALFGVYGRYGDRLGWRGRQADTLSFRQPGEVALTPGQRVTAPFFFVVAALFVAQSLLGGASEHYRADLGSFFGLDLARLLPYNLTRTWHLQMALFWVAAAFLAAGIFLAPSSPEGNHAARTACR